LALTNFPERQRALAYVHFLALETNGFIKVFLTRELNDPASDFHEYRALIIRFYTGAIEIRVHIP
jgi:hypothetical protein